VTFHCLVITSGERKGEAFVISDAGLVVHPKTLSSLNGAYQVKIEDDRAALFHFRDGEWLPVDVLRHGDYFYCGESRFEYRDRQTRPEPDAIVRDCTYYGLADDCGDPLPAESVMPLSSELDTLQRRILTYTLISVQQARRAGIILYLPLPEQPISATFCPNRFDVDVDLIYEVLRPDRPRFVAARATEMCAALLYDDPHLIRTWRFGVLYVQADEGAPPFEVADAGAIGQVAKVLAPAIASEICREQERRLSN